MQVINPVIQIVFLKWINELAKEMAGQMILQVICFKVIFIRQKKDVENTGFDVDDETGYGWYLARTEVSGE